MTRFLVGSAVAVGITASAVAAEKVVAGDPSTTSRMVAYHQQDIVPLAVQVNYTTMLQFPRGEKVVTGICGDTDHWTLDHAENILLVKATVRGSRTNINVVTDIGNVYSFTVKEISGETGASADLKVFVNPADEKMAQVGKSAPMFVGADQVEVYKKAADDARSQLAQEKQKEQSQLAKAKESLRAKAEASIKHSYKWDAGSKAAKDFNISSIYELDGFTIIEANPGEIPSVYEVKDGKDSLIEVEFKDGKYTIPKVLNQGYMRVGKSKLNFHREA